MTILTKTELAKYLKLHEVTIQKMAINGKIPAFKIGRDWRFNKEEIDKWLRKEQEINNFNSKDYEDFIKKFRQNYE